MHVGGFMKSIRHFIGVIGVLTLTSCGSSISEITAALQGTLPSLADIQAAVIGANPYGLIPGKTFTAAVMPVCPPNEATPNASLSHEVNDTEAFTFTASTRTLTLATDTVPDDFASAVVIEYACSVAITGAGALVDPIAMDVTINDLDADGVIDADEYELAYAPLVNNYGTFAINLDTVTMFRGGISSFKIPSSLTKAAFGMSPLNDDTDVDTDGDGVSNTDEVTNGTNMFVATSVGTFDAGSSYSTGALSEDVVSADLNGDGYLDIVVANFSDDNVSVLLGNGDGTLDTKTNYTAGNGPMGLAAGDIDNDGDFDLVIAHYNDNSIGTLLNDGNGTFSSLTSFVTGGNAPNQLVLGDFDDDEDLDIAVTNFGTSSDGTTVTIILGEGDGTFTTNLTFNATGTGPNHITTGDFDEDGDLDLAVTNRGSNGDGTTVSILLGDGDGTFTAGTAITTNAGPHGIVAGDFNGDDNLDLAVANTGIDNGTNISIFTGNGDGTFDAKVDYTTTQGPFDLIAFDADGDGDLDVAVATFNGDITIFANNGSGIFTSGENISASGGNDFYISTGDFNNDGQLDLVSSNFGAGSATVYLNE